MQKIKYVFLNENGFPKIKSDAIYSELDLLELVSADTGSVDLLDECINIIESGEIFWSNASKITPSFEGVIIEPAFEWDARLKISKKEFIKILSEFKEFIE